MVNKTELRIGNYVQRIAGPDDFLVIKGVTDEGIHLDYGNVESFKVIQPIALTSEILIKSAFVYGRKYIGNNYCDLKQTKDSLGNKIWEFRYNNETINYLYHVHQAQNLFYDICGEELEIVC